MRIALISDIHEDIIYLEKALRLIEKHHCEEIACLGDIVGFNIPYCKHFKTRNANACIELIKKNAKYVVAGNHDYYAIRKLPDNANGFVFPESWYSLSFHERKQLAQNKVWLYEDNELSPLLNSESFEYLHTLPEYTTFSIDDINIFISHFTINDLTGSSTELMLKYDNIEMHINNQKKHKCQISFIGHLHPVRCLFYDKKTNQMTDKKSYLNETEFVVVPAIISGQMKSGFAILDTNEGTIQSISIENKILKLFYFD